MMSGLRVITVLMVVVGVGVLAGCSMPADTGNSDNPQPTTPSIIPLRDGNSWAYRHTVFDTTGTIVSFPDRYLGLMITGAYYLLDEGGLVPVPPYDRDIDMSRRIIYRYQWEWTTLDSGYLVYHQGTGDIARRGLYIAGTFVDTHTVLFDTARLWYAYPGTVGASWQIDLPGGDTGKSTFECVSKEYSAWSVLPSYSPHLMMFFDSCYLYRQTVGDHEFYHVFHPLYGKISMRHYYLGKLQESYLLVTAMVDHQ